MHLKESVLLKLSYYFVLHILVAQCVDWDKVLQLTVYAISNLYFVINYNNIYNNNLNMFYYVSYKNAYNLELPIGMDWERFIRELSLKLLKETTETFLAVTCQRPHFPDTVMSPLKLLNAANVGSQRVVRFCIRFELAIEFRSVGCGGGGTLYSCIYPYFGFSYLTRFVLFLFK